MCPGFSATRGYSQVTRIFVGFKPVGAPVCVVVEHYRPVSPGAGGNGECSGGCRCQHRCPLPASLPHRQGLFVARRGPSHSCPQTAGLALGVAVSVTASPTARVVRSAVRISVGVVRHVRNPDVQADAVVNCRVGVAGEVLAVAGLQDQACSWSGIRSQWCQRPRLPICGRRNLQRTGSLPVR